jgi:hypothetical protein
MSDKPVITDPAPGTTLDYSNGAVTIRWNENGGPHVKKWWLSVGTSDGLWNIRNSDKQKDDQESISVDDLPASGKVWDGKDKDGNLTPDHDEEIQSDPVWWNCPSYSTKQ